jgi:hypothetical protein
MLVNYHEKIRVTKDNINLLLKEININRPDQIEMVNKIIREKGEALISCYNFIQSPGERQGNVTVFHDIGKAAICFGADLEFGDWDEAFEVITVANGEKYYFDGRPVYLDDDGSCTLGNI